MKIIIPEMRVIPEMCIVGMTWQPNPKIAQFLELAVTDPTEDQPCVHYPAGALSF
jgi:hypothetical protein